MDFQGGSCFETGKTPKIQADASRKRPRAAKMKNEGAGDSDDERKVGRTDGEGFGVEKYGRFQK